MDEAIITIIVKFTNRIAGQYFANWNQQYPDKQKIWISTDSLEIHAVLCLLIAAGALMANRESVSFLLCKNPLYSRHTFPAAMSRERFQEII